MEQTLELQLMWSFKHQKVNKSCKSRRYYCDGDLYEQNDTNKLHKEIHIHK